MPAIHPSSLVLVTGATGFLGVHVVKALIDGGFSVRGAVRSASKGEYLKKLFGSNFEDVIVEDMQTPDAYDKAVVGVDAIVHVAVIMNNPARHPDLVIKTAVAGTLCILESAKKCGTDSVKRIIVLSSMAAVGGGIVDDSTYNQAAVDDVRNKGAESSWLSKYSASKVIAERTAWEFLEENKGKISFDISTICPPWMIGPMLHEGSDVGSIYGLVKMILNTLEPKNVKTGDALINKEGGYIDVRDAAAIIVRLLLIQAAGNERFVTVAGPFSYQMVYDAVNEPPAFEKMPVGEPGKKGDFAYTAKPDKLLGVLGQTYDEIFRPFKVTVRDSVSSGMERGWVVSND